MATLFWRLVMSQVLVTDMVDTMDNDALVGFSTTSRAPSPVKRTRYRLPLCSPARP